MSIRRVGVLGLGLMGNGIVQITAAVAGLPVVAVDVSEAALVKGKATILKSLALLSSKAVAKGSMDKEAAEKYVSRAESNITTTTDRAALRTCDLVIEAAPEEWALKKKLYAELRGHVSPAAILASNTSGLLIADLAREFDAPERVLGLHYFNPVPLMQLCEVVSTPLTLQVHVDAVTQLVKAQGKTPVLVKDSPGFVVNRLLVPFLAQAIKLWGDGIASTADIDTAMKLGCGHPMGPLHLADYVGLDTTLFILRNCECAAHPLKSSVHCATHRNNNTNPTFFSRDAGTSKHPDEKAFFVPQALEEMVAKGHLGRKSGRGFYVWEGEKVVRPS
jgi:3-hydroxyacyl-CoA dehydrogenase